MKTEAGEQWSTARKIRARLKKAFDINGIEIPFPQRTVWVREVENQVVAEKPKSEIRKDLLDGRSGSDGEE